VRRWEQDLSAEIISPHFAVVGRLDVQRLVADTFDICLRLLVGEEEELVRDPRDDNVERTYFEAYLARYIDFFELRSFSVADILRAQRRLEALAEPLFFQAYRERAAEYRRATQALCEATDRLGVAFADAYNDRLMRDYYNEVSIMLHRIKNKLTAVPTSLQTILPQTYDGVEMEGDTLTAEDAEYLSAYEMLRTDCLRSTLDFLQNVQDGNGRLQGVDPAELEPQLRELIAKYDSLRDFVREHQEHVARLKRKLDPEAILRVEEFLHDALEGGELTTQLTKELQEVQNELYNRERPVWEDLDLRALLHEAFEESRVDAKGKRITYELSVPDELVPVFAVRRQLRRPLAQVINNALKYTPEDGHVWVELSVNNGRALVAVRDTGIGIPTGEEDLVFALCARCTNAQEFNKDGSGTGLYNDRKTVRLHNGEMWVESAGVGKGSTFYIELPLYQRAVATAA
jgi:signal transduction histidine kinase